VEFLDSERVPVNEEERNKRTAGKPQSVLYPYYGANGQVGWIDGYLFDEPLVLLAEDGGFFDTIGRVAYRIEGRTWVNNHAHVLRPLPGIDIGYVHFALNSMSLMPFVSGTTRLKLNQGSAQRIPIALAPQKEQKRIAARVEKLFGEIRIAKKGLQNTPDLTRRFRQSILTKAFRGELTERDPNDEPAEKLLERVRQERRKKWEEGLGAKGKDPKKYKYEEPEPVGIEGLPEIPDTWVWTTIEQLATFIGSGITPLGGQAVYASKGIPFIRSQNVYPDGLHLEDIVYVTARMHAEMKRTHVRQGDVLLNITGASIGRSTFLPEGFGDANVNQHVCIIRTGLWIEPAYLSSFFNSPFGQDQIFSTESGVTREGLNYGQIKSFKVPLAPLGEQERIVSSIANMLSQAHIVEKAVLDGLRQTEYLEQSILAKAFRGELVPQDPNDEPASVLLEEIRAQRAATGKRRRFQAQLELVSPANTSS